MTPSRALRQEPYSWLETEENKQAYVQARTSMLPEEKRSVGTRERNMVGISYRALFKACDLGAGLRRSAGQIGSVSGND